MKNALLFLALVLTPTVAHARPDAPVPTPVAKALPDGLKSVCTGMSNRRECGVDDCTCEVVREVSAGTSRLGRAVVLRAADKAAHLVSYNLVIETDGVWTHYGMLHTAIPEVDGHGSSGVIERFDVVTVEGVGPVLRCELTAKGSIRVEEDNVQSTRAHGAVVLVFAQGDELVVVELTRSLDVTTARIDKKGKKPSAKAYGPEGHRTWERTIELRDGRLFVSKRTGSAPIVKRRDKFVGEHPLETLRSFDAIELDVRTPPI